METETKTAGPSFVTVRNRMGAHIAVTLDELQAIVQSAYDRHGILATPSYTVEASREVTGKGRRYCACGLEGCSDPAPATHQVGRVEL